MTESKWTVYQCLNCEITKDGRTYILTEGKWFEVNSSFVASIDRAVGNVRLSGIPLAAEKDEKETDYCKRLHAANEAHSVVMDRKSLIHLKRYSGSSVLSHLFAQGVNSARLLVSDTEFRRKVNDKLPAGYHLPVGPLYDPAEYEVVYGIISETADQLPARLPFFSKLTLKRAMDEIQNLMRMKMSLAGIRIGP